ncbi:hypothetical protein GCM10025787_35740 [Saccharopolyspora rosea]|uniref:DUF6319 family protein n=1 Tax=Saccharopolyspora rosea TaxID=524884 RepID=A0ABW3G2M7_9PSEU
MSKAALSSEQLDGIRAELAAGTTPTVWFTASAVGVPEGRSGKVIALGEPAEGDFIQVRPAGSKDVLSFSAGEVTLTKPPRKKPEKAKPSAPAAAPTRPAPAAPAKQSTAGQAERKPAPPPAPAKSSAGSAKATTPAAKSTASSGTTRRRPRQPTGATVTVTADQDGQWSVEVTTGKKRVVRPTQVAASAVAQAAKALHDDVAAAVEPLIEAAREQQRERVERLREELAAAQRMLDELD